MPNRLRDPVTGLWDDAFFHASVRARLGVARRELKPFSVAFLCVGDGAGVVDVSDETARRVAYALLRALRESDQACRLPAGRFGVLLESTDDRGSVRSVERVSAILGDLHHLWAGIAAYPTHALDGADLLLSAEAALVDAKRWNTSRTEVALLPM
ncbi:MAG: diguanylate cyclase protein [Acidimicrobiales bacterium]|nr:diguanylate cyclase protein [Acidimicrobiales bacterium]